MPDLNEFFAYKSQETRNSRVEKIDQERPCGKCDLSVPFYNFNQSTLEMYWTCSAGHETRYKLN